MFKRRAQIRCHLEGEYAYWCVNEGAADLKVRSCPGYWLTNAKSRWPLFTGWGFHVIAPLRNCSFGMLSPPMLWVRLIFYGGGVEELQAELVFLDLVHPHSYTRGCAFGCATSATCMLTLLLHRCELHNSSMNKADFALNKCNVCHFHSYSFWYL